jgi:predicted nucleotide-binding protein
MTAVSTALAKLSGIRKALVDVMHENVSRNRSAGEVRVRGNYPADQVRHYFLQARDQIEILKEQLPPLYADFQRLDAEPNTEMLPVPPATTAAKNYGRAQLERLVRDIEQVFEIRANSELSPPKASPAWRVFISHGRANEWRVVQAFIEKDVGIPTLELAQEPNVGRTIIEKLMDNAKLCDSAVIVMTGDDLANVDESRVRENVMHEIGLFQGLYGRRALVLLHEEGVNIPTNLSGVAYVPFPKGNVDASLYVLQRELRAMYE